MSTEAVGTLGTTSSGMKPNTAALLSYVLGVVTGVVFLLIEKNNTFVRFHAMQAIGLPVAGLVIGVALWLLPMIGWILVPMWNFAVFIAWIVCMVQAYQGRWFRLPVIGDVAAKQAGV